MYIYQELATNNIVTSNYYISADCNGYYIFKDSNNKNIVLHSTSVKYKPSYDWSWNCYKDFGANTEIHTMKTIYGYLKDSSGTPKDYPDPNTYNPKHLPIAGCVAHGTADPGDVGNYKLCKHIIKEVGESGYDINVLMPVHRHQNEHDRHERYNSYCNSLCYLDNACKGYTYQPWENIGGQDPSGKWALSSCNFFSKINCTNSGGVIPLKRCSKGKEGNKLGTCSYNSGTYNIVLPPLAPTPSPPGPGPAPPGPTPTPAPPVPTPVPSFKRTEHHCDVDTDLVTPSVAKCDDNTLGTCSPASLSMSLLYKYNKTPLKCCSGCQSSPTAAPGDEKIVDCSKLKGCPGCNDAEYPYILLDNSFGTEFWTRSNVKDSSYGVSEQAVRQCANYCISANQLAAPLPPSDFKPLACVGFNITVQWGKDALPSDWQKNNLTISHEGQPQVYNACSLLRSDYTPSKIMKQISTSLPGPSGGCGTKINYASDGQVQHTFETYIIENKPDPTPSPAPTPGLSGDMYYPVDYTY